MVHPRIIIPPPRRDWVNPTEAFYLVKKTKQLDSRLYRFFHRKSTLERQGKELIEETQMLAARVLYSNPQYVLASEADKKQVARLAMHKVSKASHYPGSPVHMEKRFGPDRLPPWLFGILTGMAICIDAYFTFNFSSFKPIDEMSLWLYAGIPLAFTTVAMPLLFINSLRGRNLLQMDLYGTIARGMEEGISMAVKAVLGPDPSR